MLDIESAIRHCEEVAEKNEAQAEKWQEEGGEEWGKTTACRECASDHRQLAAWLRELKELRLTVGMIKVEDLKSALTLIREYKAENNELREQIERLDSENYKLNKKLEEIGTAFNEQVSLVGWHEEREKEYKRLLKSAIENAQRVDVNGDVYYDWIGADEANKLIGD